MIETIPSGLGWQIGADVGGTFTDIIAFGPEGQTVPMKVLTTPPDFGTGVVRAIEAVQNAAAIAGGDVRAVLHGTTVATNAILEMQGARTALITTAGFRDVLELGRLRRPFLYDLSWQKPVPLVARRLRFELQQRILADGTILRPVADSELVALAELMSEQGVEAVSVCLLNSYARPDVEREVAGRLRELLPHVYVTASVDISPEMNEYERTSTCVVNAYVGPVVSEYVNKLDVDIRAAGIDAPFLIMQSSGGLLAARAAAKVPVHVIESGPAAGVAAAQKLACLLDLDNVVAFDMGGTTAKASLIENGQPFIAGNYEVGGGMNIGRGLSSGAGYAIRVPSIDIAEVGAGGGSIVGVDLAGSMHVGPASAGSRPGPACYGLGGDLPTLTDANVILGYLSPSSLAGGRVAIHSPLAAKAFSTIAAKIGVDQTRAARAAYDIAVSNMTRAVKAVTSERGRDPRNSIMVAFGGAGPLYAAAMARELGIKSVIVPVHTGLFSSIGLLVADIELQRLAPYRHEFEDLHAFQHEFDLLTSQIMRELDDEFLGHGPVRIERMFDMRYRGQRFELRIPLSDGDLTSELLGESFGRMHIAHCKTYGRAGTDDQIEIVNLRVRGSIENPIKIADILKAPSALARPALRRSCWFGEWVDTPVIGRSSLTQTALAGPLVIEDMDATTLVPPGAFARLDSYHGIIIDWVGSDAESGAAGLQ